MQLKDLDQITELSGQLNHAQAVLDAFTCADRMEFPAVAAMDHGTLDYGRRTAQIAIPPVSREVVLTAARAARDAIAKQLKALGVNED